MYSACADIEKLLPKETLIQLTDDEGVGTINNDRVGEAIVQADSEINSYCGGRYNVPFAAVPAIVKKISVDIAIYNLYSRRAEEMPQTRTDRYKNAVRQLELIAKGSISIGIDPAPPASTQNSNSVQAEGNERTFTKDSLKDY